MLTAILLIAVTPAFATEPSLLQVHCAECHSGDDPEGDFDLSKLGSRVTEANQEDWRSSFDVVSAGEMPPADVSEITIKQRAEIAEHLRQFLLEYKPTEGVARRLVPRRLNNREFARSVASALMIEDVGTHVPLGNLIGDTLHDGFDTNGDALGISEYHLEQYIHACRRIVDAVVLSGERPESRHYAVPSQKLRMSSLNQNTGRAERGLRRDDAMEFTDPRLYLTFQNFQSAPATGRYRIKIRASGIDRGYYDWRQTGIYDGDPIRLQVRMGDRHRTYDLPDEEVLEIELDEWLAEGTQIQLRYPTDGLRLRGNGNFKFQNSIAHDHIRTHDSELYQRVITDEVPRSKSRSNAPAHWSHWTDYWRGPRPRVYDAVIEGPFYETWPSKRQVALIGRSPRVNDAEAILRPIAERAWRREVRAGELDSIVELVKGSRAELGEIGAIKEGIVAILVTPSFLLINSGEGTSADQFASKISYFMSSSPPAKSLRIATASGVLGQYESILELTRNYLQNGKAEAFLTEYPRAWLQLDRINFMAPDPDFYVHYHRKAVSEDMIAEATAFFAQAVQNNIPIPEMLTANYSFINADLAQIYEIENVILDSKLRKHVFEDKRRGGLLGMGAFLTLTADSLGTSPIHRAVYVLENFLGTRPSPPPGDIEIPEPDVRSAKTIKEVLEAHVSNESCASCHRSIDPYGYAFENFDPAGGWRDRYVKLSSAAPAKAEVNAQGRKQKRQRPIETPIDSSSVFRSGERYADVIEFRELMKSAANQKRFVRCFIEKLLLYANGEEPTDFAEVDKILRASAENDYRIVETIASVINSPLFREQ